MKIGRVSVPGPGTTLHMTDRVVRVCIRTVEWGMRVSRRSSGRGDGDPRDVRRVAGEEGDGRVLAIGERLDVRLGSGLHAVLVLRDRGMVARAIECAGRV